MMLFLLPYFASLVTQLSQTKIWVSESWMIHEVTGREQPVERGYLLG
jgi:hypothetical protein